jgi:hypothetical protein
VPWLHLQAVAHKKQQSTCEWEESDSKMLWMVSSEMWMEDWSSLVNLVIFFITSFTFTPEN